MSNIFLITAPSGGGKTIMAQKIQKDGYWVEAISHTSRIIRDGEKEAETYYFIDNSTFRDMIERGEFAERVTYDGNYYGVTKAEIERVKSTGKNVFIIVENDGYKQIKKLYPEAIGIFIHMSKEDCMANMLLRGDSLEKANKRIALYDDEMKNRDQYDYVIKNVRNKQYQTENVIKSIIEQYGASLIVSSVSGVGISFPKRENGYIDMVNKPFATFDNN